MTKKLIAFMPVRGGSKGIPKKNIKTLAGQPLLHWGAQACIAAENIDQLVVATDNDEIENVALQLKSDKLAIFRRSAETCTDFATTESAMLEFAESRNDFSHIMLVQATSPLIQTRHLDEAIMLCFSAEADSLIALVRQLKFVWEERANSLVSPCNYDPLNRPMRQDFQGILTEPGAFYITKRDALMDSGCRISGRIVGYELPEECYWDLDTMTEWRIIEEILKSRSSGLV